MMDPRLGAYGSFAAMFPGAKPMQFYARPDIMAKNQQRSQLPVFAGCLFVPWVLFVATFWLRSFELRQDSEALDDILCCCLLLPVLTFTWMMSNLARNGADAKPMVFLAITSLMAWMLGFFLGDWNYQSFMKPYFEINNLQVYPSVDSSKYRGAQLMDAGMIEFTKGSVLRLDKSMGFKNEDIYCVAPVASSAKSKQANYDFWAVGLNCCSGHQPDFKCGEYSNPDARWGLRLMDDNQRDMFRLAVKEAEATFNIKASNPILMYWLRDPTAEVNAYQNDGLSYFYMFAFGFFAVQLFFVMVAAIFYAKW